MCDPVSIAAAGGAVLSGYGAYKQSKAEKDSLKYQEEQARQNAVLQNIQAQDALALGRQEAKDHMRQVSGMKASQTAVMAANGLDVSQGTPQSLLDDTQYMGDIDQARIKRNAKREAWGYQVGATNATNTANMIGATADNISPVADGLLATAGSVASNWKLFAGG